MVREDLSKNHLSSQSEYEASVKQCTQIKKYIVGII